jgi:hypothetical protein
MKSRTQIFSAIAIAAIIGMSLQAKAYFTTNYGNFAGTTVTFVNVSETTITENNPLYRQPTVAANTLDFNPQGFGAFASGGGLDLTDGQLTLTILANNGSAIPTLNFWEAGDYSLIGSGTTNTYVDVTANYFINITKVDGVGITPINIMGTMSFNPVGTGTFTLPSNPGNGNLWNGMISVDINNALALANVPYLFGATEVQFNFDNVLTARSESGSISIIQKKDFQGSVGISVIVPEPSILAMTLCGAGLLIARRNKR